MGYEKNHYFQLISRFIACYQRYDRQVLNRVLPDRGKLVTLIGCIYRVAQKKNAPNISMALCNRVVEMNQQKARM